MRRGSAERMYQALNFWASSAARRRGWDERERTIALEVIRGRLPDPVETTRHGLRAILGETR